MLSTCVKIRIITAMIIGIIISAVRYMSPSSDSINHFTNRLNFIKQVTSGSVSTRPNPSSSSVSLGVKQTKSDEDVTAEESEKAEQEISYYKSTSTWYWYTSFLIDQANCSIVRISYCWSSKTQKTILRCDLSGLHFGITAWCF